MQQNSQIKSIFTLFEQGKLYADEKDKNAIKGDRPGTEFDDKGKGNEDPSPKAGGARVGAATI